MSYYEPPDPDPREDEPECCCAYPNDLDSPPHPDCYYHGVDSEKRKEREARFHSAARRWEEVD